MALGDEDRPIRFTDRGAVWRRTTTLSSVWGNLGGIMAEGGAPLSIALAVLVTLAAPLADRFIIRRKRIDYRVLYNSKIGLNPLPAHDSDSSAEADPRLLHLTSVVNRMSVVLIRIRNVGSFDIEKNDFDTPISFSFGQRVVWDARISEASTPELHQLTRENLAFFSEEKTSGKTNVPVKPTAKEAGNLSLVRDWLARRLSTSLEPVRKPAEGNLGPQWHGVRLNRLALPRGHKFKLVVVLQEPENTPDGEITKTVHVEGRIENGWLRDEKTQRYFPWPKLAVGLSLLLTGALIATSSLRALAQEPTHCAEGSIQLGGSSAFMPVVEEIADRYEAECRSAIIRTSHSGSRDALGWLAERPSDDKAVFSDVRAQEYAPILPEPRPVAQMPYALVVNDDAGVSRLSTQEVEEIYSGSKKNWQDVAGGADMPIKVVDRNGNSGSRKVLAEKFDLPRSVAELPLCTSRTLAPGSPPLHCQTADTEALLDLIDRTPGTIGYADAHTAYREVEGGAKFKVVPLDGREPNLEKSPEYRFRTVEYLYTSRLRPSPLLAKFVEYVTREAPAVLRDVNYLPCADAKGNVRCEE